MRILVIFAVCIPLWSQAATVFEPNFGLGLASFAGRIAGAENIVTGQEVEIDYTTYNLGFRYGITRRYINVTAVVEGYGWSMSTDRNEEEVTDMFIGSVGLGIGYEWNIPIRTYAVIGMPFSSAEISYFFTESFLVGFKATRLSDVKFDGADLNVTTYGLTISFPIEFEYPENWWRQTDWKD